MNKPSVISITAGAVALPTAGQTAPEWFMYMPAGESKIDATVDGNGGSLAITVTEADVATLNESLATLRASGPPPFFGFDHIDGRASAWPEEFAWRYDGIYTRVKWTPDGASGVTAGKDQLPAYRYFSPGFLYDKKQRRITGLLPGEAGSLVNNPAFRSIARIAAKNVPAPAGLNETTEMKNTEIAEAVIKCGLLTTDEAAGDNAGALTSERLTALQKDSTVKAKAVTDVETWRARATKAEETLEQHRTEAAEAAVKAAVGDGYIPAKDTETQAYWKAAILRDGEAAVKAMRAGGKKLPADSGAGSPGAAEGKPDEAAEDRYWASVRAKAQEIYRDGSDKGVTFNQAFEQAKDAVPRPEGV